MAHSQRSGKVPEGQDSFSALVGSPRKSAGVCPFRHSAACVAVPSAGFGRGSLCTGCDNLPIASRAQRKEGMKRARKLKAIRNEARGTWVCFPKVDGKRTTRKLGNLNELTQEQADARASDKLRSLNLQTERKSPTVLQVVQQYRLEKMPKRYSTSRSYEVWLRNHIIPKWGEQFITELRPRPVERWLESLELAPKSRGHVRGLLHK